MVDTHRGARPQLKYTNGDVCPSDPRTQLSSLIEFYCDPKAGKVSNRRKQSNQLCLCSLYMLLLIGHSGYSSIGEH